MIRLLNDPWNIDATYEYEERDGQVAAALSVETEQFLLMHAREVRDRIMNLPQDIPDNQLRSQERERAYLTGQYNMLLELVNKSKEVKVAAYEAQQQQAQQLQHPGFAQTPGPTPEIEVPLSSN